MIHILIMQLYLIFILKNGLKSIKNTFYCIDISFLVIIHEEHIGDNKQVYYKTILKYFLAFDSNQKLITTAGTFQR